jgi:TolB-like protein/tetratricopeptide (TPR) repeat protein
VRYLFEDFAFDPDRRELARGAAPVALEPQVFDLLHHLIASRGRVVGKDELIAEVWRGRIVSDSALSTRINAARSALGDDGRAQRLIRTFPRRGVRFVGTVREEHGDLGAADRPGPAPAAAGAADKPSIAVLPFANLGNDPGQDYFADGIALDITTALSRNRGFFVVARNSAFTFKGTAVDVRQAAGDLGVRYLLQGSVRRAGTRMRVGGQLVEAQSGRTLWADHFDGAAADIFEMQDLIVTRVVGAIAPRLEQAEIERARRIATDDLAAYDLYLRGLAAWNRWTPEGNAQALAYFHAAIDKDPDYPTPYGLAASCHFFARANGWRADFDETEIARLVDKAAEIGLDDPVALAWAGHVDAVFSGDVARGLSLIDRALELDVNNATAWQRSGWVRGYAGDPEGAIESLKHAIRLDPLDPRAFLTRTAMAFAHFIAGRDAEAAHGAAEALRLKRDWRPALRVALAANGMLGRRDEAAQALRTYLRIDPRLGIAKICGFYPLRREADRRRLVLGLRRAGVPE